MNIAVFCSGNGSNFQAIVNAAKKGLFKANIALMVCDNPSAYAIKRARKAHIKTLVIRHSDFSSKKEFETKIIEQLKKERIGLICLAGYMRILSREFLARYKNRILNIHPALLPSFKGAHGIKDALDYGAKVTGVTVHFVTDDIDAGPIILQEPVKIAEDGTEAHLARLIHKTEHRLYPEAIRLFIEKRLRVTGRNVKILAPLIIFLLIFGFETEAVVEKEAIAPSLPKIETQAKIETIPPFIKEEVAIKAKISVERVIEPVFTPFDNRIDLTSVASSCCEEADYLGADEKELLNSNPKVNKPLSRQEIEDMRIAGSFKIAHYFADTISSMDMAFASDTINSIIDTAKKVLDLRNYMKEKYGLHFKAEEGEALIKYKRRF